MHLHQHVDFPVKAVPRAQKTRDHPMPPEYVVTSVVRFWKWTTLWKLMFSLQCFYVLSPKLTSADAQRTLEHGQQKHHASGLEAFPFQKPL